MKKLILTLLTAVAALSASAITLDEAFDKMVAVPGAAVSDMPEYDCVKEGFDWGKVVMFIGASKATVDKVNDIVAEITDEKALDTVAQGNNPVKAFTNTQEDGRSRALVVVNMPMGVAAVYGQGDADLVEKLNIN